jgi:predicted GIY-YIG superfamily endonuclease
MVYLIHFEKKFKHAQHYIGFAVSESAFKRRMKKHRSGLGANLLKHVNEAGINWEVVRTWPDGDRNFERRLKNMKKSQDYCPECCAARKKKVPSINQTNLHEESNTQTCQQV